MHTTIEYNCSRRFAISIAMKLGKTLTGADPGFPMVSVTHLGGHGPPMWVLFGENVSENERIGSRSGGHVPKILYVDPPMFKLVSECL